MVLGELQVLIPIVVQVLVLAPDSAPGCRSSFGSG